LEKKKKKSHSSHVGSHVTNRKAVHIEVIGAEARTRYWIAQLLRSSQHATRCVRHGLLDDTTQRVTILWSAESTMWRYQFSRT